ncbi:MFS transporter [Rhodanobacter sp. FDAARGOS 1247]|uniref:AmpG family muropeptide MFS transporter n=1 Tax=unclassified Rhodanobacter TaxID=2621553 RepID=UPI000701D3BF|nr:MULTISPECIES: MFS transporter [unclassified Rhodanobacter]KQZ78383.1 MFS transporter [Rhodanobacter sp. Root561]QRP65741.1 MFS transporter [Rhodanobacter sp. FDAARGOS 1247]
MFLLGFSSGLPFLLVAGTLAYWLKENGIKLADITMIASAGMTYAFKFVWAPLLDHGRIPGFARLGQRRGWLLFAQLGVVIGLLAMALLTPAQLPLFVVATLVVAFFGATQDIAVDAYRIEIAPIEAQGALVATYSLGYRIGLLLAGAVALILADHLPWRTVYALMALAMAVPVATTLMAREPEVLRVRAARWRDAMRESVIDPFADFFRRYGWVLALVTLLFLLLFKMPEQATIGGIMSPFYRDMGFSKTEIGTITKIYGIWIGIVGVFLGGAAVARWGAWRPLGVTIVLCGCSNLLYLLLIAHPGNLLVLTLVISGENLTLGMLGPPTVAFLSSLVNRQHTATQYALLSSLVNLPGKLLGFFAGGIATATGYGGYFVITVLAVLPSMMLFAWLWRYFRGAERERLANESGN